MKLPANRKVNIYEEANRCLLCQDAPCTKACKTGDPARAIRAIRFDNHKPALLWVKDCSDEDLERAEEACIHYNWPIRIKEIIRAINPADVNNSHYPSSPSASAASSARTRFSWPHRPYAPTTRWWPVPSGPDGQACSTRPSACRRSKRCRHGLTRCTPTPPTAISTVSAIWSS